MVGYVLMHRDLMDWEWYQSPNVSRLYFHLIFKVNFKDKKWQGHLVKRGQLITSNKHLAIDLGLSVQAVRTAIQKLKDSGCIKIESTNRFTLITVVNYEKFQSTKLESNKPVNSQKTIRQQASNIQLTTTKESNKEKKVNKEKIDVRREKFKKQVFSIPNIQSKILDAFFEYWSELNIEKTKMRFESERFFEINKRIEKWVSNEKKVTHSAKRKNKLLTNR